VRESWIKRLTSLHDPVRRALLEELERQQTDVRPRVRRALREFDRHRWQRLARTLAIRACLVPPDSPTAERLVLERYLALRRRHQRAMRSDAARPWHALRVELKGFRYAVELLLPARTPRSRSSLRRLQTMLGEIHDLDVLHAWLRQRAGDLGVSVRLLDRAIAVRRHARVEEYRQYVGPAGPLPGWSGRGPDVRRRAA
jgi:CHAD domain-containing protein